MNTSSSCLANASWSACTLCTCPQRKRTQPTRTSAKCALPIFVLKFHIALSTLHLPIQSDGSTFPCRDQVEVRCKSDEEPGGDHDNALCWWKAEIVAIEGEFCLIHYTVRLLRDCTALTNVLGMGTNFRRGCRTGIPSAFHGRCSFFAKSIKSFSQTSKCKGLPAE